MESALKIAGTGNMNLNYDVEDLLDTASGAVSGAPGGVQVENRNFDKVENPKVSVGKGVAEAKKSPAVPRLDSASPLSADGGNVSVGDFEGSGRNAASPLEGSDKNVASPLGKITLKNPVNTSRHVRDWSDEAIAIDYAVRSGRSYEDIEREFGSAATMNPLALKHLARARREGTGESSVPILTNTLAFSAAANSVWSKCGGDASRLEDDDKRLIVASFLRSKGFEMQDFAEADGALKPLFGGKSLDAVTEWVFNSYLAELEKYDLMAEYSRVVPSRREDWLQANGYADATKFMVANAPKGMAQNFVALMKASPRERELAINLAATLRECASTGEWFKTHTVMRVGEKLAGLNPSAQMRVLALMDSMNPDLQKNFFVELGGRIQESFENTWNGAMTLVEQATISASLPENLRDKESTRRAIEADLRERSLAMGAVKRNYAQRGMIGELLMDTGVMFADTALIMGAAAATGGVGAAVATAGWFGVGSAGNAYQDMVAKGVSPDDALIPALTIGVAEAGSEYLTAMIPLGRGVKNLIVGKGAKSAALDLLSRDFFYKVASGETQATVKGALGRFMGRGALGMAEETGTELVSSAWSAGVYKHLGIYEDGEFLDEAAQIIKTMPGVFLLGALTGTGAGKLKQRWKGGAGPITQLGMELDLAKMESDKQTAEAMRMAGSLLGMKFNAATGDVIVGRNDALGFDLIDHAEWGEMSGNEKTQELEAKFFRGEKHGDADVAKARELFDFMSKLSEAQAEGATRTATENAAAETAEAEREAEAARTADNGRRTAENGQGTNETEGGNARQETAGEKKGVSAALREFVENMAIWKRLEQEAQDYDIAEDVAAALGSDVEAKRPEVVEALKKIFERGDSDAHVASILSAYAKRAIALEKMSGGKAAEGATKPSALALLVEAANSYGDFGNATGERIVEPEQTADGAESAIPKEAFAGIPEAWRKTLAAAFLVIDRHAAALKGTTHDVASAKREIAAALKGKKGFHELSDTARAMLSALERYDGDLDGVRRWLSAYASGARRSKGARTAKELSADADEFATGSREIGDNYAARRVYVGEGELTEAERNLVRAVSRINAATGGKLQIRFFDGVHADAYGFIEGDVIHVNRQGAQALLTTFGHEFTHWLEGNANYAAMRDFVLKPGGACELIFTEMFGRSFAEHKARIKADYKARGHELSDEQADAELLADACGATLFTRNFDALTEIRRANKGFFGKLLDFLKRLVNAVRGTKFEREVSEAVELYRKAAFEARRAEGTETNTETNTETKTETKTETETAGTREEETKETERTEGTEGRTQKSNPANETFRKIVEGEWEIPQAVTDAVPELKGKIVCDEEAYAHIWSRHKKELQGLGYESAKAFVEETLANADAVYAAKNSGYDLVARLRGKESSANRVFVYLKKTKGGDFYDVGTAHITKSKKYENTNPLWERTPNVSAVANLNSEKQNPSPKADAENGARDGSEVKPIFDEKGKVSFGGSAAVSVTEDKWGIYRAYADEAGEKHKFPSQYPSFRELLVRVALKRGVPKDEVFREASERLTRAMQEADNGQRATESGNASGGFSGENGRGNEYSSGNPAGTRNAWSARTPSAEKSVVVSGEYRVVDADELTFVDVSDKAQQNEQERNRQGRRTQQQTRGMLDDFVAERLLEDAHTDRGAPIYRELEDGKLRSVSGEGRSRLLKDVYDSGGEPEAQYRAALEKFARERGIEIPAGIKKPVLVRVAKDAGGMSWAALAKASNMDMKSAYSTAERAHADARELGKCLPLLNARSEDDLLGEKNHAFVVAFNEAVNAGTEYVQDRREGFKETLATRIQEALVAYVIDDREAATDLFDSPYSLKNALNTLMDLAVDLARLKENERYDVSRELAAALKAALAVRELKRKGDARTPEQLIETHFESNALEGIGENVRAGLDLGAAKMLANLMLDRKTGLFGRTLIGYVSEVERENGLEGNDIGLFDAETDWGTKSELMKRALDKANGEKQTRYSLAGYEAEQSGLARKYSIDAGTASLVGLHEISEEKLRKAIALGGLANPSLGVVDLNARAGTGFGAITLIAPRTLIDKKTGRNAGTYAGDAWTPMVPQVKLIGNEKTMKAADAYIDGRVGNPEIAQHVKTDTRAILSGRGNNQYLRYVFLKERGIPVPERVTPIRFPEGTARKVIDILGNESFFAFESELSDAQKRALTDLYFEVSEKPDASEKMKNALKKMLTDEKGLLNYNVIREFLARARSDYREGGKLDAIGTISDAVREVSSMRLESEYVQWRDELLKSFGAREQIYAGETRTGRSRYIDATLENISKEMNKKAVKDSGDDTNFGSIKASLLKSMTSLKQIRSKKELLNLSDADAEAAVEETKDRLVGVFNAINAKKKLVENPFMNFDYSVRRVKDALNEADPKSYLENEYGYEIEEKLAQELSAVKELLQNLPAKYFETKFRRPVGLGEFRAAVVPAGTDAAVVSALKNAGVSVEEYAADDEEDRSAKVRGVAAKASDVRFSLSMEASAEYLEPSDFGEDGRVKPEILEEIEAEKAKIREDAQKNGSFMKAPNGAPSKLNAEQWVLVRTKRFKRWFGDWEKAFAKKHLEESEAIPVASGQIKATDEKSAIKFAAEWAEKHLPVKLGDTEIVFDARSVKTTLSHKYSQAKLDALTSIPEGFKNAVFLGERKDFSRDRAFDSYYAYPIVYEGSRRIVFCRAIKDPNTNRLYLHEVFLEEKLKADSLQTAAASVRKGPAQEPHGGIRLMKNILLDVYRVNEENVSKVVDENGEPKVVYHGTGEKFYEFSHKFGMRNGSSLGRGFYFTEDEDYARGYGNEIMGVFLNIRNPLEPGRNKISKEDLKRVIRRIDPNGDKVADYASSVKGYPSKEWYERSLEEAVNVIFSVSNNYVETSDSDIIGELFSVWGGESALRGVSDVLGYDGFIPKRTLSDDVKIAFFPEQAKSATENVGTYARENPDIRYSISTEEQDAWNGVLDAYEAGELKHLAFHKVLNRTPEVLIRCGLKNRPITIRKETIDKITGKIPNKAGDFHQVPVSSFRRLLYELDKPIAVFRSVSPHAKKSVVVLTELLDLANGKNVIVPLEIDETNGSIKSHRITSAYGRPDKDIRKWISGKLMLYADKEKLPNLLAADAGAIPAALPEGANIFGSEILNNKDSRNDARGTDSGKRKFSLPEMEESEETIRARARERARERAKQERARKRRDAYGSLKDIGAESRRMIQDFIREHNELYSDPAAIRRLKVKGIALAKLLLERGLDKADAALLDAVCGGEPEMLRRDVKARGELLARLMRENLDNTAAVKATVAQITAMSNRIGRMRAYARLSSMLSFGSAEAYDALDAIERERRARDETAVPADVDKDKLAKIGVGKRLSDIGLSADLSDDAAEKRENADRRVSEIEDEAGEEEAGDTKGAREDEEETESAPPPPPGARKGELRELKDTPKAVAESVAQLVLDTIFGAGKVSVKTMKTDLRKIGATEEQRATLMKTLRKTATEAITDAMHDNVPRESRARISVVLGKLSTETDVRALVNLLERGFALIATSSVRASRAQMYAKINRLLKPWRTMKSRESELNRRVSGEREEFLHECWKAWTSKEGRYHSMRNAANRMEKIKEELEAIAEKEARGEATEDDAARARKRQTELHALELVGGARVKSVVDLAQIAWDLETGVEDDRKEHKERVKEARERNRAAYMEVADAAKAAKRDPEKKMGAVAKLLTSVESLRQWFEGIIRYAGGETERKARERVDKIERDFAAAAYRRESLAYRRLTKLRGELERIFGKDLAGAMKNWRKAREELARFSSDGKTAMSLAALANLYAQVRQEHYAAPLKERERYSDENEAVKLIERRVAQIPEMEAALGEKGVAVVNALCGMLRDLRPELRAAFKGVTGYEFYTEENYFPIQRKKGEYGLGKAGVSLATLPLRFSARIVSTQDVVEDVSIFDAFDEAANSSEHFIAYSQLHMFWQQAFLDADFSGTIRDHCGRDVLANLRSRVTDILAPKLPQKETGADPFMNKLVSGAAITALGGNVLVMLRQFTSVPAFMFNMSVGDFAKYSATLGTADGIAALGEIVRDNAWFRQRFTRGFGAELNAILQGKGKAPAKIARALAIYMLTNNMGDSVPILFIGAGIFRAAYENGIKNGLSEADAKQAAHAEVARHCEASQQTGRVMNMGDAQRANGAIARAIMQFKSTTQQFLSYEVRAVSDVMARPTDAARWAKLAKVLMLNHFILPGLYSGTTMLFDLLMGGDPDEWTEDWVAKFALPMLLGPGSGIVFVGDALTSVSGGLSRGLPALEAVRKGRRLLAAGEAWIVDDDTDKALDQLYKLSKELCPPVRHAAEWIENHAE